MKKILATAMLCAVSSFASWDKFPVIEHEKGEVKIGWEANRQGNSGGSGGELYGIRYSPVDKLEIAALANYRHYTLGTRYQITSELSAGLDIGLPIPRNFWRLVPNAQYSMQITETLILGSNAELAIHTEDENKTVRGMELGIGAELDLVLNEKNTVWLDIDIFKRLTESETDGNKHNDAKGMVLSPGAGYKITLGNLILGTNVAFYLGGEDVGLDPYRTQLVIDAAFKF